LDFVKWLVEEAKEDCNVLNSIRETPLFSAAQNKYFDIVQYFVGERKCQINLGEPAWMIAFIENDIKTADYLIQQGADVNQLISSFYRPTMMSPLIHAIVYKDFGFAKLLVQKGVSCAVLDAALRQLIIFEKSEKMFFTSEEKWRMEKKESSKYHVLSTGLLFLSLDDKQLMRVHEIMKHSMLNLKKKLM